MARERWVLGVLGAGLAAVAGAKVYEKRAGAPERALAESPLEPLLRSGPAPDFSAPDEAGRTLSLGQFRGRLLVLNFWYTDCEPCRDEMPSLNALARSVAGRGVEIVALSVDPDWKKVRAFHESDPHLKRGPAYRVLLDPQRSIPPRYGTFKFPETFLISPEGRLLARFVGPRDWSTPAARRLVESLAR